MSWNIHASEPPRESLPPRYFTKIAGTAGAFRELLRPPKLSPPLRLALSRDVEGKSAVAHLHAPGDGWHYLPARAEYVHNGDYWFATLPTPEGPILANVADLCRQLGISFEELYRTAYPTEGGAPPTVTSEDRAMRTRPARLTDARKVLADLEAVNYHSLHRALADALRAHHIPF